MNARDDELHEWAGAYALGALDPDDRRRFEQHVEDCQRCADELRGFAAIPGLLAQIERDDLVDTRRPETARAIAARAREEDRRLRSGYRRWRMAAIASAAGLVLVVATIIVVAASRGGDGEPTVTPTVGVVTASVADSAAVSTTSWAWGTEIHLELGGLPERGQYQLWAVDDTGGWTVAATWGPTPTGGARITGATSVATDRLERLVVTSDDPQEILVDATV